jgi:hypothetical protein
LSYDTRNNHTNRGKKRGTPSKLPIEGSFSPSCQSGKWANDFEWAKDDKQDGQDLIPAQRDRYDFVQSAIPFSCILSGM